MKIVPTTKAIKETGIAAGELLGGFIGGHALRTHIVKSDKKWINPVAALASAYVHASAKNDHVKSIMLGAFGYFGIKSLKDLTAVAVSGLEGVEGMDGLRDMLNKIVPSLGDTEIEMLSGDELAAAEADLLGLLNGNQFTPYTEVPQAQIAGLGSVANL